MSTSDHAEDLSQDGLEQEINSLLQALNRNRLDFCVLLQHRLCDFTPQEKEDLSSRLFLLNLEVLARLQSRLRHLCGVSNAELNWATRMVRVLSGTETPTDYPSPSKELRELTQRYAAASLKDSYESNEQSYLSLLQFRSAEY